MQGGDHLSKRAAMVRWKHLGAKGLLGLLGGGRTFQQGSVPHRPQGYQQSDSTGLETRTPNKTALDNEHEGHSPLAPSFTNRRELCIVSCSGYRYRKCAGSRRDSTLRWGE